MGNLRVRAKHQPFEVAALVTTPIHGVPLLALDVRPPSVQMFMPEPIQVGCVAKGHQCSTHRRVIGGVT